MDSSYFTLSDTDCAQNPALSRSVQRALAAGPFGSGEWLGTKEGSGWRRKGKELETRSLKNADMCSRMCSRMCFKCFKDVFSCNA